MKTRLRYCALPAIVALLGYSTSVLAQRTAADEAAIRDIFKRIEKYYAACDSKGMASLYAPDGERVVRGIAAKGRAEIEKTYEAQCSFTKGGKNRFVYETTFPDADTATIEGTWINDSTALSTGFTFIARKISGRWLIATARPRL